MKKIPILLAVAILALACKKERWLRTYNNGEFEDSINVTGWEVNEDVVQFGCDFYYPWQGEDSIDYRGCEFYQGKKYTYKLPRVFLEVNGKIVGFRTDYLADVPDSSEIMTIDYCESNFPDSIQYDLSVLKRFPNLIGISIYIDAQTEFRKLDSIPSNIRLYLHFSNSTDGSLRSLSQYQNVRVLLLFGDYTHSGLRHLLKLRGLRIFKARDGMGVASIRRFKRLPKLRHFEPYLGGRDVLEPRQQ